MKKTQVATGWVVEVVELATGKIVRVVGPQPSERMAEKLERGLLINMNHDRFGTNIVVNCERTQKILDAQKEPRT